MGEKPDIFDIVGKVLLNIAQCKSKHRVMRALASGDHAHTVVKLGSGEIGVQHVACGKHLGQMVETLHRGGGAGVFGDVIGVVDGKVRHHRLHVEIIGQHEQL